MPLTYPNGRAAGPEHPQELDSPRVLFFSGKGGVGKTTLAGTAAVRLAARGARVLIASTDPAHSLSDLFDSPIGSRTVEVTAGVDAVEVDAPSTVDNLVDGLGPLSETSGVAAAAELLKLASHSPGVDEIVSLDLLLRLVEQPTHDAVVLDTAPTGHTLRLLALPELMDRYFGRLLQWRGQFSKLSRRLRKLLRMPKEEMLDAEELGVELSGARGRMRRLGDLLRDPERCSLVLVTIPEAMSVLETTRTLELLRSQNMAVSAVAINMIQPSRPDCRFCTSRREAQLRHINRLGELAGNLPLILVEHEIEEPRGRRALIHLAERVWARHEKVLL